MRILVTNDDGIDATGLIVLARRLTALGDVVVVAPDREYSGSGAAIGALHVIQPEVRPVPIDGVPAAWSVAGPPALCVMFARLGVFGERPDLVVSGINPGANTGRAIYHSGTVGAAITARNGNMAGLAVSQAVSGFSVEGQGWAEMLEGQQWDTAAEIGARVAAAMLERGRDRHPPLINLNVPNCALDDIAGWRRTEVARLPPRSLTSAKLVPMVGHDGAFDVEMDWGDPVELPDDTDTGAVEGGYVSITALGHIVDDETVDIDHLTAALGLG